MSSKFNVTGEVVRPLSERIKKCRQADGKSITDLASDFGVSRSSLSKIISGSQVGGPEIIQKLEEYAEKVETENPNIYKEDKSFLKNDFVQTKDANSVIGVCSATQETSGLGVIVGKSGFGKTHALKYYASMPRVAYVECDSLMSAKDLLTCIEEEIGVSKTSSTNIWPRLRNLQRFFAVNLGWLLIVDEADKLINAQADRKLETLRALFDQSTLGVVVAGEPKLKNTIENYSDRFSNRVDYFYKLEGIKENEVITLLEDLNVDDEAVKLILDRATNKRNGCFRLFDRTMDNIGRLLKLKEEEKITVEIIQEASSLMML